MRGKTFYTVQESKKIKLNSLGKLQFLKNSSAGKRQLLVKDIVKVIGASEFSAIQFTN